MASYSISVTRNDGSSALFELLPGRNTIGQQRGEIATLDPQVADPHAELHFDGMTLTYIDAGSAAGSFLPTGERLSAPMMLQPGASVRFGGCQLTVQEIHQGPTPSAPQAPPTQPSAAPVATYPAHAPAAPAAHAPPAPAAHAPPAHAPSPEPAYGLPSAASAQPHSPALAQTEELAPNAGVFEQLTYHLRVGLQRYKKHYLNGAFTIGLVVLPAALLNALLGWIPIVGFIVAILVGVVQLVVLPLSVGAMGRWALAAAAGQDLHWKKAWKNALKDPVQEWLNVFVAQFISGIGFMLLIVPGLITGMFALPAYLLEDKKFVGINSRSAELVMKDPASVLGLGFLTMLSLIPVFLILGIVVAIAALLPVVGAPMAAFLSAAINIIVVPFLHLLWAQIYYATVRRLEGNDPVINRATKIQSWSTV